MGLHVCNIFVNREASSIEAVETANGMSVGKGITIPGFGLQVELQMLVLFLKFMAKNHITTQIFQ